MAFDSITPVKLGQAAITVLPVLVHTVPALSRSIVKTIDICNTTTSDINVNIYLVPSGDTPTTANALLANIKIKATTTSGGFVQWGGSQVLNEGDTIQASASAVGLTINISGGEAA